MEIVINSCFGGFGLSHEAELLYVKKAGFDLFYYHQTKYKHRDGEDLFERFTGSERPALGLTHAFKKDMGDSFSEFPKGDDYWHERNVGRSDPILVDVVKQLGKKANGVFAKLEVVEIPDGVEWEIEEYDGNEHVVEVHRTWR